MPFIIMIFLFICYFYSVARMDSHKTNSELTRTSNESIAQSAVDRPNDSILDVNTTSANSNEFKENEFIVQRKRF